MPAARGEPPRQLAQSDSSHGRLDLAQSPVGSKRVVQPPKSGRTSRAVNLVIIFSMVFVGPHALPQIVGVGGDHATLAGRGHDLVLAERKRGCVAERSDGPSSVHCSMRLSAILHYFQTPFASQSQNGVHLAGPTGKMHSHNGLGCRRTNRADSVCGNVSRVAVYIGADRARP